MSKISTESYKGVRDFYPEDKFIQKYIFDVMRKTAESFGYAEYDASILEPAELYRAKSGEEIVNEQTYTFTDRGDREVTLRPEMTPTVARMVAGKYRDLTFPLRWYSIPNLFRYEKPQRGRLREHWQLNVDLFGADGTTADAEVISVASTLMKNIGAKESDFIIRLNSRKLINEVYQKFLFTPEQSQKVTKLLDKKDKITPESFNQALGEIIGSEWQNFERVISNNERLLENLGSESESAKELVALIEQLETSGVGNVRFDPTLMRGFDYYTGTIFEIFDTNPENSRALFGGGRYDELLAIFDEPKIPAIGFGAGDVTMQDFLKTHDLLPAYKPSTDLFICVMKAEFEPNALALAQALRAEGVNTAIDVSGKKVGDQIKIADKQKVPYILVVGENEVKSDQYTLKRLSDGNENKVDIAGIVSQIKIRQ
jgi:histidyl-tRNA synthetase